MFDSLKSLFSSGSDHPLDKPKEDHQVKRREADQDLEDLRDERDDLREALAEKREQYEQAKAAGNDEEADDYLRDAEQIKKRLDTKRGRIDEVAQQRNFAANMLNIHEMRSSYDDEYWRQLKEMDEETLTRVFADRELEVEQMVDMLQQGGDMSDSAVDSYRERTANLHRGSDLEAEWTDEVDGDAESDSDGEDAFDTDKDDSASSGTN